MAITYVVSPCKGGYYGVYVRALSGDELAKLAYKLPELDGITINGGVPIQSDRITRKKTKEAALRAAYRLATIPKDEQLKVVSRIFLKPAQKEFKLLKLKYFRFSRDIQGVTISPFTSQDKEHTQALVVAYSEIGVNASMRETVGKTKVYTPEQYEKALQKGEQKLTIPKGLTGLIGPADKQGPDMIRRISQKRKRTTTNSFWQKYR